MHGMKRTKYVMATALAALTVTTASERAALAAPTQGQQAAKVSAKPTNTGTIGSKSAPNKSAGAKGANSKDANSKGSEAKDSTKAAVASINLTGTWNIKVHEGSSPKTHIMAVKVTQKGSSLSASGVDEYGDVLLTGTLTEHNGLTFKRTYKGTQVNPPAQYDGTFTPATELTPVIAKGKWSAQPFADKNQKPKASANSGDWEAHIFTGPAINK